MLQSTQPEGGIPSELELLVLELYKRSAGEQYGIHPADFGEILQEVRRKYLPPDASALAIRELLSALKVEDLILARACAAGHERAWEAFMLRYREKLYDVAGFITKESSSARDLADSLYADLYGTIGRDGQRTSKLSSYTGRGSLEGWLRTVMAQEHVNRYRRQRRLISLDEEVEEGIQFAVAEEVSIPAVDPRIESAVDSVLNELHPEDRFVLASYFMDGRTLAEIGRTLGVHESTISRKLDKLVKLLRKNILAVLVRSGMSRRQAQEALEVDVRDLSVNIRSRLSQEGDISAFSGKKSPLGKGPA